MGAERLQKVLASAGIASRRDCEELIASGRVTVNGRVMHELGARVDPAVDAIAVDGRPIQQPDERTYVLLHKPVGVVSTADDPQGRPTVVELVGHGARLFPVGRLDADSEGLILLTDDGELAHKLTHPSFEVEKEYRVLLNEAPSGEALRQWREGVLLEGERTAPAWVEVLEPGDGGVWVRVVLREGRKRQIREVARLLGYEVLRLVRVREDTLLLGDLPPGEWRALTADEVATLHAHPVIARPAPRPSRGSRRDEPAEPVEGVVRPDRGERGFRPRTPYGDERGGGRDDRRAHEDERGGRDYGGPPSRRDEGGSRGEQRGGFRERRDEGSYRGERGSQRRDERSSPRDERGGLRERRESGGYRDERGGGFRERRESGSSRGEQRGGFRDERGGRDYGGPPRRDEGGSRGERGSFRDERGGRDYGGPPRRDEGGSRGERGGGFRERRDERGGRDYGGSSRRDEGNYRGEQRGGFRERRDERGGGFRERRDEGGFRGEQRSDPPRRDEGSYRGERGGGFRERRDEGGFRGERGGGFRERRDDRGGRNERGYGSPRRDERGGGFRDERGGGPPPRRDEGGFRGERGGGFRERRDEGGSRGEQRGGFRERREERSGRDFGGERGNFRQRRDEGGERGAPPPRPPREDERVRGQPLQPPANEAPRQPRPDTEAEGGDQGRKMRVAGRGARIARGTFRSRIAGRPAFPMRSRPSQSEGNDEE